MGTKSRVAIIKCGDYDKEKVYESIKTGIEILGGLQRFVPKEGKILLKPNLLSGAVPEKAVTTHPSVFEGVLRLFKEEGYSLFYGDSPGLGSPERTSQHCGLKSVADEYGLELGDFVRGKTVDFADGIQTKQFEITNAALEADTIVNICKMKTHMLERITGAVKNTLGCVYGLNKGLYHSKFPDAISFGKMLVDLNLLLKPRLHIMDGIVAMEGNGPRSGDPVKMNVILISDDPVALDSVFCRLVDLNPEIIPTIKYGEEAGLGKWRDEDIEMMGDDIEGLINKSFNVAKTPIKVENVKGVTHLRGLFLRKPVVNSRKCIKCGICVEACPVPEKAIGFQNKDRKTPPGYEYSKCIRCYCCQEMCPEKAITVKTPILGKVFIYK